MIFEGADIAFTDEILSKAAKELGHSKRTIEYLYQFCLDYLNKQIHYTDCCSFNLPHIGTMYVKSNYIDNEIAAKKTDLEKNPENTEAKKKKVALEHKKQAIRKYIMENNRPMSNSNHYVLELANRKQYNKGKTLEEIQDIQNEIYIKNKEFMEKMRGDY